MKPLKAVWQVLTSSITYNHFINKIIILTNFSEKTAMQWHFFALLSSLENFLKLFKFLKLSQDLKDKNVINFSHMKYWQRK